MKTRYHGSRHRGAVRFAGELELAQGTSRCNCSICHKTRFSKAIVPAAAFHLLAGAEALAGYRFGSRRIAHRFCRHCGVKLFGQGAPGEPGAFYAVNLGCLDDLPAAALAAAPLRWEDGRHDRWERAPEPPDARQPGRPDLHHYRTGSRPMKYLCLVYYDEAQVYGAMSEADLLGLVSQCLAYGEDIRGSGHFLGGEALQPVATARTVRVRDGRLSTTDGPFAETKEQLAGFYLLEAADLNEAIQLAARIPPARLGSIEVRPIRELPRPERG